MFKLGSKNDTIEHRNDLRSRGLNSESTDNSNDNDETMNLFRKSKNKYNVASNRKSTKIANTLNHPDDPIDEQTSKRQSMKKNLSKSFNNLISGFRKTITLNKNNSRQEVIGTIPSNSLVKKNSNSLSDISVQSIKEITSRNIITKHEQFKKTLSKQKNEQLSSYYLKNLNEETNTDNKLPEPNERVSEPENYIEDKSKVTATQNKTFQSNHEVVSNHNILVKQNQVYNDETDNQDENDKHVVRFSNQELEEKLDLIDDLPGFFNDNSNRSKLINQTSISSETPSSLNFGSVSSSNNPNQYPSYYELKVKLVCGKNLAIRDIGGSSDPYAKFLLNGVNVFKSKIIFKNLNPEWNEEFSIKLSPSVLSTANKIKTTNSLQSFNTISENFITESFDSFISRFQLKMFVYDYDRGFMNDDLIGYANIDIGCLKENVEESIEVELEDEKIAKQEYLGLVVLEMMIVPKFVPEEKEKKDLGSKLSNSSSTPVIIRAKRAPYQLWQCVLNVVLLECNDLLAMDDNGLSDPYVKFRLENERYRSKTIRRCLNPRFLEQFQLYIYDMNKMNLNISVFDYDSASNGDDFIGKTQIDLRNLEFEKTNFVKLNLENNAGTISLLLTVTGIYDSSIVSDMDHHNRMTDSYKEGIIKKYGLMNSFKDIDDVGWLKVKVLRAENLASADINGKSDPFCCLQLINDYVQTFTVYKTLNPEWGQVFEFKVTDIHSVLEVTVLDEDKNKVYEFLGKFEIPLTSIQNGKKKLYSLKDKKLLNRAKGAIELEMELIYNPVKAVLKTFNPRDEKFITPESKLKVPVLKQNIMRVHNIIQGILNTGNFIDSCFRWVNPVRSIIAFISYILIVLNFEIYMLPLALLAIFLKNYIFIKAKEINSGPEEEDIDFEYLDEEEETVDPEAKEPKKSFRERLNEIQEICLKVQETLDFIASMGERVINTFMFTTPWLSWLAIIVLIIVSTILYLIPLRYLLLLWGVNKFTKKFRKPPNFVDNTEILDFLSRVPSKKEQYEYKELRSEKASPSNNNNQINANSNIKNNKKKK